MERMSWSKRGMGLVIGGSLLVAMAAGLPCLATSVEGIPFLISDGIDGCLVPAGDPVALRMAIEKLAGDEGLRQRIATAGLETVREHSLENERFIGKKSAERYRVDLS